MPDSKKKSSTPPPANLEIRPIELEDLAPIFALGERVFTADRWSNLYRMWDEYEVVNLFTSDRDTCLVAEADGELMGFALGSIIEKRNSAWVYGYLLWLAVDPETGRQGVGSRLLARLTDVFIAEGCRMMLFDTETENEAAVNFFRKAGFGDEHEHVYMSKNLTKHPHYEKLRPPRARRGSSGSSEGSK